MCIRDSDRCHDVLIHTDAALAPHLHEEPSEVTESVSAVVQERGPLRYR